MKHSTYGRPASQMLGIRCLWPKYLCLDWCLCALHLVKILRKALAWCIAGSLWGDSVDVRSSDRETRAIIRWTRGDRRFEARPPAGVANSVLGDEPTSLLVVAGGHARVQTRETPEKRCMQTCAGCLVGVARTFCPGDERTSWAVWARCSLRLGHMHDGYLDDRPSHGYGTTLSNCP
jgi:hypothetical protein